MKAGTSEIKIKKHQRKLTLTRTSGGFSVAPALDEELFGNRAFELELYKTRPRSLDRKNIKGTRFYSARRKVYFFSGMPSVRAN